MPGMTRAEVAGEKVKVCMRFDAELYSKLKMLAVVTSRSISEIVEDELVNVNLDPLREYWHSAYGPGSENERVSAAT